MNKFDKLSDVLGKLGFPIIILCLPLAYLANKTSSLFLTYNVFWFFIIGFSLHLIGLNNKWIYSHSIEEALRVEAEGK